MSAIPQHESTHEVLTLREAAAYLRLPERTFRRLLAEGKLPGFRLGQQWRFRRSALEVWMEERETQTCWRAY